MRSRPHKYNPLSLLEEDLLYGTRVRRVRDKAWVPILGCIILAISAIAFYVKSKPSDFEPMRHPLASIHVPKNDSAVRYLVFGSYDTHGHGLEEYQEAYPYLLSEDVHNAAIQVGGPALGAVCTQSMTGEGTYDVIVLDFVEKLGQGLRVLAKRLRQRFPNALMIIVKRWSPAHIAHFPLNGTQIDVVSWMKERSIPSFYSPTFHEAFNNTDPQDWIFTHTRDRLINEVVEATNARLVELPRPRAAAMALLHQMHLFHPTSHTALSERGHEIVADMIKSVVNQEGVLSQDKDILNEVGPWYPGDSCHMWYTTGQLPDTMYQAPTKVVRFAKKWGYKYALEFAASGGSITVHNPFDIPRTLYLTYMTLATTNMYPRVQVQIGGRMGVILDPANDKVADLPHSPRTVAVGMVNPGSTTIQFESLSNNLRKFRLTGASLLGNTEVPFEHTLEVEPADDSF
mmetsp:Transcript_14950/g.24730  ORF Transcript_14950/g.24730 Transcript_14950/m.24730 type:complete len:457 (-) Transcript_14950:42-1412(-)